MDFSISPPPPQIMPNTMAFTPAVATAGSVMFTFIVSIDDEINAGHFQNATFRFVWKDMIVVVHTIGIACIIRLPNGPNKTGKVSIFIEDLSGNSVFWDRMESQIIIAIILFTSVRKKTEFVDKFSKTIDIFLSYSDQRESWERHFRHFISNVVS